MRVAVSRVASVKPRRFMSTASDLIVTQNKNLLQIELNRPKALNALSNEMVHEIKNILTTRINTPESTVGAFVVKGNGGKAFCAGGDVKNIWQDLQVDRPDRGSGKPGYLHTDFFRYEYIMNYLLGSSIKPQISIWDGIVMGGGVGVSVLGEFRVATEKSMFAMPETAIGLFPDVGSSAWLPHLADGYGNAIGLTGVRLGAADLLHTGIATHYVTSDKLALLETELTADLPLDPVESRKRIKSVLDKLQKSCAPPDESKAVILKNQEAIRLCFGEERETLEEMFAKLREEAGRGNEWAKRTVEGLEKMCPASLKLTVAQLQRGKPLDLKGCLQMEFRMMMGCMRAGDFKEGVRALLVDKDNKPKWNHARIEDVTDAEINGYFINLGEYELNVF